MGTETDGENTAGTVVATSPPLQSREPGSPWVRAQAQQWVSLSLCWLLAGVDLTTSVPSCAT